jgi:thioesterase domain-containing protein/acyl carrier protein
MEEKREIVTGVLDYKTDLFNATTITRMLRDFQTLLESIVANPEQHLLLLPLFTATEPDRLFDKNGAPTSFRQKSEETFVAPQDELELQLTKIWETVLGVHPVSIRDNFFVLGGHSLLAVRLFDQIEQEFGRKLPLSTLFEAPTVEQLSGRLRQSGQSDFWDSLVLLKSGNSNKQPLFLIHDADGKIILYLNLAHRLESERSVYGLRPYGKDGYPILHTRIADMAAHYIEKIRSVQPEGPYLLGGLCVGGNLAFEMAVQLQAQGQKVSLVALIDATDVQAPINRQTTSKRLNRFSQILTQSQQLKGQERLTFILKKATEKVKNLLSYESLTRIEKLQYKFKVMLYRYYLDKGLPLPQFLQNIPIRKILGFDAQRYVPQVYQGRVTLFRSTEAIIMDEPSIDDTPVINFTSDPLFGWGKRATGGVEVYDVPGGHSSSLQEPYVQVLAEKIKACINAALPDESSPTSTNNAN